MFFNGYQGTLLWLHDNFQLYRIWKKIFHQLLLSVTLGNTLSLWAQLLVGDFYNKLRILFCHTGELFRVILAGSPSHPTHPVAKHQDNESKK